MTLDTSTALIDRLMDTVEGTDIDDDGDFPHSALALLALAISRLSSAEREDMLQAVECGALRRAVSMFGDDARPQPYPKARANGDGKTH